MAELEWTVEGRRFRNAEEYQAALRDKELIDSITGNLKLDNPKDIETLYLKLKKGQYTFETIVGRKYNRELSGKRRSRQRKSTPARRKENSKSRN